jgi:hypothetical protein
MSDHFAHTLTEESPFFENDKQALIYLTLLREGPLGAEKLCQKTGLHRESIQRELIKMAHTGVVILERLGRNKKARGVPVPVLQDMLARQSEGFESILKPLLEAESKNSKNTQTHILYDDHAFALLQLRLIKLQPKGTPIPVISTQPKSWISAMIETRKLSLFEKIRLERLVNFELVCFSETKGQVEENAREYFAAQPTHLKRKYRYVNNEFTSPLQIQVWHSCIVISIFTVTPSIHIVIENPQVVRAMLAYHKILWSTGEK